MNCKEALAASYTIFIHGPRGKAGALPVNKISDLTFHEALNYYNFYVRKGYVVVAKPSDQHGNFHHDL